MRSFPPVADRRSRVLVLGSMPGPVALAKKEYYGFPGNHFWRILPEILGAAPPRNYREKKALLLDRRIALWDVLRSCERAGASDSAIRRAVPNDVPRLLRRCPEIRTIFLNGKSVERLYRKYFGDTIRIVAHTLPSTSPAHASMPLARKIEGWKRVLPYLENRNPWC